jgi:hypothetical protein
MNLYVIVLLSAYVIDFTLVILSFNNHSASLTFDPLSVPDMQHFRNATFNNILLNWTLLLNHSRVEPTTNCKSY